MKQYFKSIFKSLVKLVPHLSNNDYPLFVFSKLVFWNRFFIIILTAIISLCFLSIFSAIILEKMLNPISFASNKSLIIELYPVADLKQQQNKIEIVSAYLKKNKYVSSFQQVPKKEIIRLINDFTGDFKHQNTNLNVPSILVVTLNESSNDVINQIRDNLSQMVKDIYIDTEKDLVQRLASPINTAKYFAIIVPLIAIIILAGLLFLITSSIIFSNKRIINVLILLGAYTNDLANEFGKWIFLKSLQTLAIVYLLIFFSIIVAYLLNINLAMLINSNYILANLAFIIIFPLSASYLGIRFMKHIIAKAVHE